MQRRHLCDAYSNPLKNRQLRSDETLKFRSLMQLTFSFPTGNSFHRIEELKDATGS